MKTLKFKNYDSDSVRAYFKHKKKLYCIQPGHNYLPALICCTPDGEPSNSIDECDNYTFANMPPDGNSWSWSDMLAYFLFTAITSNGQLISRMNDLFLDEPL